MSPARPPGTHRPGIRARIAASRALVRLAGVLLLGAAARAEDGYTVVELTSPPEVKYRVDRDLDGDGLVDLVVLTDREAWVWRGRQRGPIVSEPDDKLMLPEGTAFFDVAPAGGLVARTATAYFELRPGGAVRRLDHVSGPGVPKRPGNILWRGMFHEFDGDGRPDFLDVSLRGYAIRYGQGGDVLVPPTITESVDTDANAASERLVARHALGDWTSGDFDGDGRIDFAVSTTRGLTVYPGTGPNGHFDPDHPLEIDLPEAKDGDLSFLDLNLDGRTDLLAVERADGKATVLVADREQGLRSGRRIRLAVPGHMRYPVVEDLDGDGRPDLALPYTAKPSVGDAVRLVLRGEVPLKVPLFLNRGGDNPIARLADRQITIPLRIRVGSDEAGQVRLSGLVVVENGGDLDGDGRKDLLVTLSTTELACYRGVEGGRVFAEDESFTVGIPDCAEFDNVKSLALDLNGDARSDILLHYRGAGRQPDRLYLLLSGKK